MKGLLDKMTNDKLISANALIEDLLNKDFYPIIVKRAIEEAPAVEPDCRWISVKDRLPDREKNLEPWGKYNVVVLRSHWPTSTYDICDSPYDETFVTTASYDGVQKIWHLDWGDWGEQLNALIDIEDSPLNGDYVTHWMPLPEPPKENDNDIGCKNE